MLMNNIPFNIVYLQSMDCRFLLVGKDFLFIGQVIPNDAQWLGILAIKAKKHKHSSCSPTHAKTQHKKIFYLFS